MRRTRRNTWAGQRAAHSTAAHIGWAYRGDRKKKPLTRAGYLQASGVAGAALWRYRSARKTTPARLLKRRFMRKHKTGWRGGKPSLSRTKPYLVNSRRRVGSYARFVQAFARRSGLSGPALFRAAARARRGGRPNQGLPGAVYFDNRKRSKSRRPRRKARRNTAVLPYMAWGNKRRKARRNAGAILPYAAFNPSADNNPVAAIGEALQTTFSVDFWKDTVLPLGVGFIGGQFAGGMIYSIAEKVAPAGSISGSGLVPTVARIGSRAVGAGVLSGAAFLVTKNRGLAGKVLAGGLVAVLAQVIQEIFGAETYAKMTGMSDIGLFASDLTTDLKKRIADSIRSGMRGTGAASFVTAQDLAPAPVRGVSDFLNTQSMPKASPVASLSDFAEMGEAV